MMKKLLILLLLLLPLSGCVFEYFDPDSCQEEAPSYYLSFVLTPQGESPATKATKAAEATAPFDKGLLEEHLVKEVDLYFYEYDGSFRERVSVDDFSHEDASESDITRKVGDFTVKLSFRPYRMLVALNMRSVDLRNKSVSEAMAVMQTKDTTWRWSTGTTVNHNGASIADVRPFRMSSSAYVNAAGSPVCDVLIPDAHLYYTPEEAAANPLEVYIDRMAAKVTVQLKEGLTNGFTVPVVTPQDNVAATVTLLGWGLNALNRSGYYYKQVDPAWSSFAWTWNNAQRFRSYWAKDPNYPDADNAGIEIGQQTATLDADKFYYRFPAQLTTPLGKTMYCLENTADGPALPVLDDAGEPRTLFSRATHVLVRARLSFSLKSGTDDAGYTASGADFFRYKGVFYTRQNLLGAVMGDTQKYYKMVGTDRVLLTGDDVDFKKVSEVASYGSVIASYDRGERVCIVPKETETCYRGEETTPYPAGTYLQLPETSGGEARIDGLAGGEFYYAVPVEHLNNDDVTGATYPTARYGVVRNHSYGVVLTGVLGVGTGIWDKSYDIRPFRRPEDLVSMYVKIYPWKQFETKFVFVDPSGMLITDGQLIDRLRDGYVSGYDEWEYEYGWYF